MQNLNLIQDSDLSLQNDFSIDQTTGEIVQNNSTEGEITQVDPDVIQHTNESIIKRLIPLHINIADITADVKMVLLDAKEAGLDATALNKIAKAFANQKVQKLVQETAELLDLIQSLDSASKSE
jgi:uncharacterized protein (UPF0335 family)